MVPMVPPFPGFLQIAWLSSFDPALSVTSHDADTAESCRKS
jgi:hypothetical protein